MAAYPSNDALRLGNGLRKSNIPTLILAGEWDGLTRITRVLDTILDCEGLEPDHPDAKRCAKQRVIVLPGVNHSDFANGVSQTGDMDAELDVATAHTSIARAVAGYWNEILLDRPFGSLAAREQMPSWQSLVSDTRSWAVAWAKMDHLDATSCLETQKKLLPNDLQSSWEVAVKTYESVPGFTFAKPSVVETSPGHFKVTAIQSQDRAFNPLDLSSQSRAFQRLSCKLKSEMALRQVVADSQRRRANPPDAVSTCGALNNALYQDVLSQLPPELVSRLERRGAVLSFGEDLVMSSGPQWISAKPKRVVDSQERRAVVSVPRLQTGANAPLHLDGMHYCQLVSPTQLAEWLFFDGFKVLQPQKK